MSRADIEKLFFSEFYQGLLLFVWPIDAINAWLMCWSTSHSSKNFFPNFFNVMLQLRRQYLLLFTKIFSGWINVKCNFYFPYPISFFIFCSIMCSLVVPKYQNVFWSTLIRDFCQFPVNICYNLPIISKHHTFVKSYIIHNYLHRKN